MHTTHYSIVDAHGNAASVTTTLNDGFGSAVTVTDGGFLLNNEMDDFTSAPGKPNMYGLVQGEANAIAPGKRMLSAMTPSIVLDPSGRLNLVVGTPGGPRIITMVYHVISNECGHQGGPLGEGKLEGFSVVCPWHQWKFDVTTGNCLSVGGSSVRKYEVAAAGDDLFVKV